MKTPTKISLLLIALLFIAGVTARIVSRDSKTYTRRRPPTLVKVELPKRENMVQNLSLSGDVLPISQAKVFARVYGTLEKVEVNIGDYVRANQVLAHIDTTELAQEYLQAEATYRNALAVYDRAKSLQSQNLISQQDYDNAETGMTVAKENADAARTRLDYAVITAPFSGFITRRYLDPGAVLTSTNATLFDLMDLDSVKVVVNLLEKDVPTVNIGTQADVTLDAFPDRHFKGAVTRMSQAVALDTRTMPVEIDLANKDHALRPGMFADVSLLISEQPNALTVPTQALLKDSEGYYVLTALNGTAHRRSVTLGPEDQLRTEILTGLSESDSVITTGQQFARDGGPITIQP